LNSNETNGRTKSREEQTRKLTCMITSLKSATLFWWVLSRCRT